MGSQILLQIGKGSVDGCKSLIDRFAEVLVKLFFVELRKLSPEEFDRRPETNSLPALAPSCKRPPIAFQVPSP